MTPLPILCFGDSLTAGYYGVWPHTRLGKGVPRSTEPRFHPYAHRLNTLLSSLSPPLAAEHHGYPGWTAEGLLPELETLLKRKKWGAAVILAGSNDVLLNTATPASRAAEHVAALHGACDRHGVRVLVLANPDCDTAEFDAALRGFLGLVPPGEAAGRRQAIKELGDAVLERAGGEGRAALDLRGVVSMGEEGDEGLWDDCIHFSERGSDKVGEAVFAALRGASIC